MDSIQRLRSRAQAAGALASTTEAMVSTQDGAILIEPTNPAFVYVPVYDPYVVYAPWPYPAYPPYFFPDIWGGVVVGGHGFGWVGFSAVIPLWGWSHVNWRSHHIDIDRGRFGNIDRHRTPPSGTWAHDPGHRHGVPYAGPVQAGRFGGSAVSRDVRRGFRGYPTPPATPTGSVIRPSPVAPARPTFRAPQGPPQRPPGQVPAVRPPPRRAQSPGYPPTFESFGRGADVRNQAQRGQSSRMSAPSPQPRGPAFRGSSAPHAAPAGGNRRR